MDRKSKGGRIVIYVKEPLAICKLAASLVHKKLKYIVLDICLVSDVHITVIGIYHPPATNTALEEIGKIMFLYAYNFFRQSKVGLVIRKPVQAKRTVP